MVGNGEEVEIFNLRGVLESLGHTARTVGNVGVGMQLAEVELIAV